MGCCTLPTTPASFANCSLASPLALISGVMASVPSTVSPWDRPTGFIAVTQSYWFETPLSHVVKSCLPKLKKKSLETKAGKPKFCINGAKISPGYGWNKENAKETIRWYHKCWQISLTPIFLGWGRRFFSRHCRHLNLRAQIVIKHFTFPRRCSPIQGCLWNRAAKSVISQTFPRW